jgi:pathogenesis-related protein 1
MRNLVIAALLCSPGLTQAPPAASLSATGSALTLAEARTLLELHNQYRAEVGVPPLVWSPELAAWAQEWADHLASTGCGFEHRPDNPYGENLAAGPAESYGVADGVKAWYAEKKDYPGGPLAQDTWGLAGHYTQMVWRQTTRVGCGKATCFGNILVVCNYDPRGNWLGQSPY